MRNKGRLKLEWSGVISAFVLSAKAFCLDDLLRIVILAARRRCQPGPQRGVGANRGEKVRRLLFYGRPGLSIGWITRPAAEPRHLHLSHHPTHSPDSPARRDTLEILLFNCL